MKISIWDILTGITLLGILCLIGGFGAIIMNPTLPINPMRPPGPVATIAIPTPTVTVQGLPPTWTPVPVVEDTLAPGLPTLRPTSTLVPTFTQVVLPTFTPSRTPRVGATGGSCQVIFQNPQDNTTMPKDTNFDMRWTIKNTSGNAWRADSVDIRYTSGDRFHMGNDVLDMPYDVATSGMLDLVVTMHAPATPGSYLSNWALIQGEKSICRFFVTIQVK